MLLVFRWGAACPLAHANRSFIDPRRFSSPGSHSRPSAGRWGWLKSSPQLMIEAERKRLSSAAYNQTPNMNLAFLALTAALLAANSGFCNSSSVPSFILPFTDCVQSRGKDGFYRGAIDVTESGTRCMNWTEVAGFKERYPGKGIGEHNHCRNPDGRIRPWCFFRNHKGRVDWGYCDCKQGKQAGLNTHTQQYCILYRDIGIHHLESVLKTVWTRHPEAEIPKLTEW